MSAQTEEVVYNEFAADVADVLEKFDFRHLTTTKDAVEIWKFSNDTSTAKVSIDYISGDVAIEKRAATGRIIEKKKITLSVKRDIETAVRIAVRGR